ncbi:15-cis-phytoene desaturase [Variovorax sp. PBL-H6]|uniref:FAD-dependent oxidoreductase n=1 Tax=Variovorax sp. PBL-H6 TaxID=434009 RepID=UPI0013168CA3|nr:FAD-dependent oxidoreductase [Variovorax sp. PBL-H6]VTU28720.1 15-cis-phytoene desaturase [Variovorax sp. PBL-H6]
MASRGNKKNSSKDPIRVAIIGGGCAGLAAAWQLSRLGRYEITVYEKRWLLGGKGASSRDDDGRIREHGLHIWLGFYENAFRMMRQCYAHVAAKEWGPKAAAPGDKLPHGTMDEAFVPEPHLGVAVRRGVGSTLDPVRKLAVWSGYMPPAEGMPGDDISPGNNPFTLPNYLIRCYELLKTLMLSVVAPGDGECPPSREDIDLKSVCDAERSEEEILEWSVRLLRGSALTAASVMLQVLYVLRQLMNQAEGAPQRDFQLFRLITAVLEQARKLLRDVTSIDRELRKKMEVIDIVITIAVGLYRDRVLFNKRGLDAINGSDYKRWLEQHGASPDALHSEFLDGIYDLTFAYKGGDDPNNGLAAGVALRGALRMFFTYRGAMFWRMRSGMGDAVFAPLYKVLLDKNVKFRFLHALDKMNVATIDGQRYVSSLDFKTDGDPEALAGGKALDDCGCWPGDSRLFSAAGATGDFLQTSTIDDFDALILATGVDDFFDVVERSDWPGGVPEKWQKVATAATQSAQVWLSKDLEELGWRRGSGIITALGTPFETWADMTHTMATEKAWRENKNMGPTTHDDARSIAYFCGVIPGDAHAETPRDSQQRAEAERQAQRKATEDLEGLLHESLRDLWPAAFANGRTALDLRIGEPHVQVNLHGSDRYTLSLPGEIGKRVSPLDRSIANMTIAGDWTASGLDAGCVEAAVMSGMLAAYAISGDKTILKSIVAFDHP